MPLQLRIGDSVIAQGVVRRAPVDWKRQPVSVALVVLVAALSIVIGLLGLRHPVTGDYSYGLVPRRWLRDAGLLAGLPSVLLGQLVSLTMGELLVFTAIVWFAGRDVERVLGSHRFLALLAFMCAARPVLVAAASTITLQPNPWYAVCPSVSWLGAGIAFARRLATPPRRRFEVLGIRMCDQTSTDFLALQLLLVARANWVAAGVCGMSVASLGFSDAVGVVRLDTKRLPAIVDRVLQTTRRGPTVTFHRPVQAAEQRRAARQRTEQEAADVAVLRELGFSENQCRAALRRANGDVNRASVMLLDGDIPMDA